MRTTNTRARDAVVWSAVVATIVLVAETRLLERHGPVHATAQAPDTALPLPIRNDAARQRGPDNEILVLRHHRLRKGAHEPFFQLSKLGVWPWFARIGARVTGQWVVVDPRADAGLAFDDVYRLARYASFEHWRDTRGSQSTTPGGNGPARSRSTEALRLRRELQVSSEGGYFLHGRTATTRPVHLPGVTGDRFELVDAGIAPAAGDAVIAIRHDVSERSGPELVTLMYHRIRKGAYDDLLDATVSVVWPFEEKLGARPIGRWQVIHPPAPSRTEASPDYDEMITMTRYASYAHYQAMLPDAAALLGGNGPDWHSWREAKDILREQTIEARVEFLEGHLHHSPPYFMPALAERYRLVGRQ